MSTVSFSTPSQIGQLVTTYWTVAYGENARGELRIRPSLVCKKKKMTKLMVCYVKPWMVWLSTRVKSGSSSSNVPLTDISCDMHRVLDNNLLM